ncbi:hypothetical protein FOI42_RS03550 [Escherichia coli]|nr:hypothetical protein [Escherichia coli]EFL4883793.1 hypothetical protein [Escherichia coli]MED6699385.1 hypothetical protein [Escherichia coli O157]USL83480.1 hypothetical protein A4_404 [Escherichia phage A4]HCQ0858606.1 hypothetical protein [Escherichia coli]
MPVFSKNKTTEIIYKSKEFEVLEEFDRDSFDGYKIVKEKGTINHIVEYMGGVELAKITCRPTKNPVIFSVRYGHYGEERYNSNTVSRKFHVVDGKLEGESRQYSVLGLPLSVKYFHQGHDVTIEIMDFIGFNGTVDDFNFYVLAEDEAFNIMMKYGSRFKFLYEYNLDSKLFDNILQNCL